ncbi:alkaline phosphatase [Rhodobaculum claviforme]|uniref:Alkaline phosphatase n=1 Tax=Rhodobaculum claviforme TaxID=1549854 RepID=A0A934WIH2_9RHOB|nr:alkaline phosphatase [Rhodobaculum claviforme]MBK5926563.1 hypothetical protein [Rhodobaculum claviforme]
MTMPIKNSLWALALSTALVAPAYAQDLGAKNVILMISDGIGFNGWLASDYYQGRAGQQPYQVARPDGTTPVVFGQTHWSYSLVDAAGNVLPNGTDPAEAAGVVPQGYDPVRRWMAFETTFRNDFAPFEMPYTSYTDSAAAGTALHSGIKTSNAGVNMDWTGTIPFRTIAEIAMDQGRAAGTVTSVQASHATPASALAHNPSRNDYEGIFNEMVGSPLTVIMGAGHPFFDDSGNPVEPAADDARAFRFLGGRDTVLALTGNEGLNGFTFVDDRDAFAALAAGDDLPERVVGIARARNTLQAARADLPEGDTPSGMAFNPVVPDLATMSVGALNVLNQTPDGFFVMIEGGAVDWMGHANNMERFIEEQIDFDMAVAAVIDWVETNSSWNETLLIVTSDHETGGIWGEGTWTNGTGGPVAADRSEDAIEAARFHPADDVFHEFLAVQDRGPGTIPGHQWASGNHTNELVPLWALGVGSELFAQFAHTDLGAQRLWGEPYGWDGAIVDNTAVFHVMNRVFAEAAAAPQPSQ